VGVAALFLDRDGVVNVRLPGRYVTSWDEFEFREEFLAAAPGLARRFELIVVVTNQRGIERGHMTEEDLAAVHERMLAEVAAAGGRIDAIYHCPHVECADRKPNPGLLLRAAADHGIDLAASTMVGDQPSDREAAERAGVGRYLDVEELEAAG
jgi:histidinol-phosphate phosphatase family protein